MSAENTCGNKHIAPQTSRFVERCGVRVEISSIRKPSASLHGIDLPIQPLTATTLAGLIQRPQKGLRPTDYAALAGRPIENEGDYSRAVAALKVQIFYIREAFEQASQGKTPPDITTLYVKHRRDRANASYGQQNYGSQQAYILTPPIIGKPTYQAIQPLHKKIGKNLWALHVDVAALSEDPGGLRIYKCRIDAWRNGVAFVKDQHIPLSALETATVASVMTKTNTHAKRPGTSASHDFGTAVLAAAPDVRDRLVQVLAKAAKKIENATGRKDISAHLLARSSMASSPKAGIHY